MKTFKIFGGIWGQNCFFWYISETWFSKQFSLTIFFSTLNSKTSRNKRKMRHKLRNGQNLPHESSNFTIFFFKVTWRKIQAIFPQVWDHITKRVFFLIFFCLFSILNSRMSENICIWRHKLCNSKTGVGPTFTWSNEPWYMWHVTWFKGHVVWGKHSLKIADV